MTPQDLDLYQKIDALDTELALSQRRVQELERDNDKLLRYVAHDSDCPGIDRCVCGLDDTGIPQKTEADGDKDQQRLAGALESCQRLEAEVETARKRVTHTEKEVERLNKVNARLREELEDWRHPGLRAVVNAARKEARKHLYGLRDRCECLLCKAISSLDTPPATAVERAKRIPEEE